MKTKNAALAVTALILAAASLPRFARAEAAPHSWAVGWEGLGNVYFNSAAPAVKYTLSDKTAFELIPTVAFAHTNQNNALFGESVTDNHTYNLAFDVIRKVGTYQGVNLSWLVEPSFGIATSYSYSGLPGNTHTATTTWGLGAGLELEYFVIPNLSVGSRAVLIGAISTATADTDNGSGVVTSAKSIFRTLNLSGQVLSVRYYFGKS